MLLHNRGGGGVINPGTDLTVLSWRRMISTDVNQYSYSWAFALSLATLPDKPLSLMEIRAYKDQQRRGACQQWLRRLTWIIYLGQSRATHSLCASTVIIMKLVKMLSRLVFDSSFHKWIPIAVSRHERGVSIMCLSYRHSAHIAI